MVKQIDLSKFGVTAEEVEKSKDILPTLELGKMDDNSYINIVFDADEPKIVEHNNRYKEKKSDPDKVKTNVIPIRVNDVIRPSKDGMFSIPFNLDSYTLWLSSKSLSLGIAKIALDHDGKLKDIKVCIHKTTAEYKDYGENTCYRVSEGWKII